MLRRTSRPLDLPGVPLLDYSEEVTLVDGPLPLRAGGADPGIRQAGTGPTRKVPLVSRRGLRVVDALLIAAALALGLVVQGGGQAPALPQRRNMLHKTMTQIADQISQDLTAAMKSRDELRTSVLRMAKSALTNKEIEKKGPLDAAEVIRVLQALVKQREDSIEQFERGGRKDLADQERAEATVLRAYVPEEASEQEIAAAVEQAVRDTASASAKDIGKVIKAALTALKAAGKPADGKKVNEAARRMLGD